MDPRRFEAVTRDVGAARNRREAMRAAAVGVVAGVFGIGGRAQASAPGAEGVPIYHCKVPGQLCQRDRNCCSRKCDQGVCSCSKKGAPCYEPLRGSVCCSARCKNGKCT